MVGFGANFDAQADLAKLGSSLLDDKIAGVKLVEAQANDRASAEWTIAAAQMTIDANAGANAITTIALENPLPSVISVTRENFTTDMLAAAQAESNGDTEGATALRNRAKVQFDASAQGVFVRALDGATEDESKAIQYGIVSGNLSEVPPQFQEAAQAVIELQGISPDAINSFEAYAAKYRETGADTVDRKIEFRAFNDANAIIEDAGLRMSTYSGPTIDMVFSNGVDSIANSGLKPEDQESLIKSLADKAALAHLSHAFYDQQPTPRQLQNFQAYINSGIDTGALTADQIKSLDQVRLYTQKSGKEVTAKVTDYIQQATSEEAARQKDMKVAKTYFDISQGHADGSNLDIRIAADELMKIAHPELEGLDAGYLIAKGQLFNDPKYNGALQSLSTMPVLPQSVLTVFRNTMINAIPSEEMSYSLRAWQNLRHITSSVTGSEIASPAIMAAMKQEEIVKMDMLSGIFNMQGMSPERVQEASRLYDLYQTNSIYKKEVEEALGVTVDEFVYNLDIDGLMPEDYESLKAATLGLFGSSTITGLSPSGIAQKLEEQINFSYPNDGWVANGNLGLRSSSAPSIVLGANAPMFKQYLLDTVSLNGFDDRGVRVTNVAVADLNNILQNQNPVPPTGFFGKGAVASPPTVEPSSLTYLRPDGPPTAGAVSYTAMLWRSFANGGPIALRQEVIIPVRPEAGAMPMKIYPIMTLRSNDPKFVKMVDDAALKKQAAAYARGDARIASDEAYAAGDIGADPYAITLFPDASIAPILDWSSSIGTSIVEGSRAAAERNDKANANVFNKGK